ncbi:MAG: DUF2282 domain-containing protein [Methylomonas sp.]|jgi:uncharacterized membrane protein|uniref:BufA1 family periplasmic bufferin-type metallophore n=1 Tax=Methylomonas sp. TaxID=418 RepID=UPI0025DC7C23|nr:DUF2282 domain-containing protein [Methylomonas sp.]MCK9605463.1 DUF2282 domain-containing protein [Methylomonas sp.]
MRNSNTMITAGLAAAIALGMQAEALANEIPGREKCYGIVKAGKSDCRTVFTACAGHAFADHQTDGFVVLPAGTRERIVGGSLTGPTGK